ncbi:MAG: 2-oxoacid:acceptor oxidoreductase subunit alpha [Patescibacteria group bacterium]
MLKTVKIAGPAGLGIKSSGQVLSRSLIIHGFNVVDYSEYPSLVRGGHNTYQCSFTREDLYAVHGIIDYFFSVRPGHWQEHSKEFSNKTLIFTEDIESKPEKGILLHLPLKDLSSEAGSALATNTVCLGVISSLLKLDKVLFLGEIKKQYPRYAELNQKAFEVGFDYSEKNFSKYIIDLKIPKKAQKNNSLHDGNESFGWGFLKGGGNFYAAYPMTPATGTLHFLAEKQKENKIKVLHPEDEIAASNMAAGAAMAGARVAVGTSGGGFALMNETVSFCGIAEIGVVFYLVSRPGPATGLPTWTSQADLLHAIYSGHGEFPKVVLAPGDWQESFEFGIEALNLVDKLQTPVIVLSDKLLGESSRNTSDFSSKKATVDRGKLVKDAPRDYKRYQLAKDGISPRTLPGTVNGEFLSNSYEHDEYGYATENAIVAKSQMDKRALKLLQAQKLAPKVNFFGDQKAKNLIISWGSTKGPILESFKLMKNPKDFAFLQIRTLNPINPNIKHIINSFKTTIVIENNQYSQLVTLLKSQFDFNPTDALLKYDGRPFMPEEIYEQLKSI